MSRYSTHVPLFSVLKSVSSIHGFKSIGYVHLIPLAPVYSSEYIQNQSKMARPKTRIGDNKRASPSYTVAIAIAVLVLGAAFAIPYLSR